MTSIDPSLDLDADRQLRRVFFDSPVGMVFVGLDRRILQANPAAAAMAGREVDDLVGTCIDVLLHPDERAETDQFEHRLRQGAGVGESRQKRFLRGDGTVVTVRVTVVVVTDESSGEPLYLAAILEELTALTDALDLIRGQRQRLELTLEAAEMTAWELDLATGEYNVSENVNAVCGVDPTRCPMTFPEFIDRVHPDDLPRFLEPIGPAATSVERFTIDFRFRDDLGAHRWFRSQGKVAHNDLGDAVTIRGTIVEITGARAAEAHQRHQDQVYRRTIDAANDAFVAADGDGRIVEWNPAAERLFGWPSAQAMGRPLLDTIVSPASPAIDATITSGSVVCTGRHRSGKDIPIEVSFVPIEDGDDDGDHAMRAFIRDAADRVAREEELAGLALLDSLTHLPNRTLLLDRLDGAMARLRRRGAPLAALFIDLDGFKAVNDSMGHAVGDELLMVVSQRMRDCLRPTDTLARLGGDEFVVLSEDVRGTQGAVEIARRLTDTFAEPFRASGRRHHITASIGIRYVSVLADDVRGVDILGDADTAMYHAKALGPGNYAVFDAEMRASANARAELDFDLHRAVDDDEFVVAYQPVVTVADEQVIGLEALVRWNHPRRGLVAPGEFIGTAEATGLIRPIGLKVLSRACRQLAAWRADGRPDLCMAINLSGAQLSQPDLPDQVAGILAANDLPPGNVSLEITESMLMAESDTTAAAALNRLHELGVTLAVDDFGTGYSSLLYLRRFPIDILKLDRAFVSGIATNETDRTIVGSTIDLAHSLGLIAIAEGVESADQLYALQDLGCDLAQGYYWSRPQFPGPGLTELFDRTTLRS